MPYSSYSEINTLEEFPMVAGTTQYLDFNLYNQEGVLVEVTGKVMEWRMSPYGQKNVVSVIKTETPYISDAITYGGGITNLDLYTKRVTLNPEDTENLNGKFVHQPVVIQTNADLSTTTFKPAQGTIVITSEIRKP